MSREPEQGEVYCRDCGEVINEKAEICPHCGVRQREPNLSQQSQQTQKEKDPGLAAVASFILPGLGQVYNGQIGKGIIGGATVVILAITVLGLVLAVPLWIWLVYDAYKTAEKINQSAESVSANTNQRGKLEIQDVSKNQRSEDANKAVISALSWYQSNCPEKGLTKNTHSRFKRADSLQDLSESDLRRIIDAIDAYSRDHNESQALNVARDAISSELEARSDQNND